MLSAAELANLRIVLVDVRNPLNIGAAARAVSNFGFSHFRLVHPYDVAFQGARSAVGDGRWPFSRSKKFAACESERSGSTTGWPLRMRS